ncbi:MAG: hypothetical protein ACM3ZE_17035, partial [Myxococcales bacterium]
GLWLLLCPPKRRTDAALLLSLGPILGIAGIGLFHANAFSLKVPFPVASIGLSLVTVLVNAWASWRYRADLGCLLRSCRRAPARAAFLLGVGIIVSAVLLVPVLDLPYLTAPWRIGPDAAGYAGAAKFILDRRTTPDTYPACIAPIDTVAGEFIWVVLRRGYPLVLAFYSGILQLHPIQVGFYLAALCYLLLFVSGTKLFWDVFGEGDAPTSILVSLACCLNCNLLFFFLEGGYGQIASMALSMGILVGVFSYVRLSEVSRREDIRLLFLVGLLVSAAATFYTESIFLIIGVTLGYLVLSFLRTRFRLRWPFLLLPAVVFLFSPEIVGSWFSVQLSNVGSLAKGNIGWPQPQWIYALELLGLRNMYLAPIDPALGYMKPEDPLGRQLLVSATLFLLFFSGAMTLYFSRKTRASQWFFLAAGLVTAAHLYFRIELNHTYAYTKIAVFLLPLLLLGLGGLLVSHVERPTLRWLVGGLFAASVSVNGVRTLLRYRAEEFYLTDRELELLQVPRLQGDRLVVVTDEKPPRRNEKWFWMAILSRRWTRPDVSSAQTAFDWQGSTTPVLFLERNTGGNMAAASKPADTYQLLWQGSEYRLVDPGLVVRDVFLHSAHLHDDVNFLRGHGEKDAEFRFTAGWSRLPHEPYLLMVRPNATMSLDVTSKNAPVFLSYLVKSLGPAASITFSSNGRLLKTVSANSGQYLSDRIDISNQVRAGLNAIQVSSSSFVVPNDLVKNGDMRKIYAVFGAIGVHHQVSDDAAKPFTAGEL